MNLGANADPNMKWISCTNPRLNEKCLHVQFENGDIDIAKLYDLYKDSTNYIGYFKSAPDVRVFASIPHKTSGFDLIHVSLISNEFTKKQCWKYYQNIYVCNNLSICLIMMNF